MSNNRFRNVRVRSVLAAGVIAVAVAVAAPSTAFAQPPSGSSDGGIISGGSAILDSGSAAANDGSELLGIDNSVLNFGTRILNDARSAFNNIPGSGSAAPTQVCNQSTLAGGPGITQTNHQLGRSGPLSFVLSYETVNIPDLIEVFYQDALIYSTGYVGDAINEGSGSAVVNVPPGGATSVLVKVTGPGGTEWSYNVGCPIA